MKNVIRRMRFRAIVLLAVSIVTVASGAVNTNYPAWWIARGVIDQDLEASNTAYVTHGQLKWMVKNAYEEFAAQLPAAAIGSNIQVAINDFKYEDNWLPVNEGQLLNYAEPFYAWITNVMGDLAYTNTLDYHPAWTNADTRPWEGVTNYCALINQGQMKHLFAFKDLGYESYCFVATNGTDDAVSGGITNPYRTIQYAVNQMNGGDTLFIRGGEYRECVTSRVDCAGSLDRFTTLRCYGEETPTIKASELCANWIHHENYIWKLENWTNNPQQVFVDGAPLQQIGNPQSNSGDTKKIANGKPLWINMYGASYEDMKPGSYYWQSNSLALYVWLEDSSNPTDHCIEAGFRWQCMKIGNTEFFRLYGLHFRHANTFTLTSGGWPTVSVGSNSVVEACDIQWGDNAGIFLQSNTKLIRCNVCNNGVVGVQASDCTNILVSHCTIYSNNYRYLDSRWGARAGMKFIPDVAGVIEHCDVAWNRGNGIWFDLCDWGEKITVRNNRIYNNTGSGVFIECTKNADLYNNLIISNFNGVCLSGSDDINVFNNTIVGSVYGGLYGRRLNRRVLGNVVFANNAVYNTEGRRFYDEPCFNYDVIMPVEDSQSTITAKEVNVSIKYQSGSTGTGYIMYSAKDVHTRYPDLFGTGGLAQNFAVVVYDGYEWWVDDSVSYTNVVSVGTDILVAEVDFDTGIITLLEGEREMMDGIRYGYESGDLLIETNVDQSYSITNTFTPNPTIYNIYCDYNWFDHDKGTNKFSSGAVYTDIEDWAAATGYGQNSLTNEAVFWNELDTNFSLAAGSCCINAGNNIAPLTGITNDYAGGSRVVGGTVDIGCYEYADNYDSAVLDIVIYGSGGEVAGDITEITGTINANLAGDLYAIIVSDDATNLVTVTNIVNQKWFLDISSLETGKEYQIIVYGYNSNDIVARETISIVRGDVGTGQPEVMITGVTNKSGNVTISGQNNSHTCTDMVWSITYNDKQVVEGQLYATSGVWAIELDDGDGLSVGLNSVAIYGTNEWGVTASDDVLVDYGSTPIHYVSTDSIPAYPYHTWTGAACAVQQAVDAASDGDTVILTNGIYSYGWKMDPVYAQNRVWIDKAITLTSVNGPEVTVIEGNRTNKTRCLLVDNDNAVIENITFQNGYAYAWSEDRGMGKYSHGGGVVIRNNQRMSNCVICGCQSPKSAGGCVIWKGVGCTEFCTISNNTAAAHGGGVQIQWGSTNYLYNCVITANKAGSNGGGMYLDNCAVSNCLVYSNSAAECGGGVCMGNHTLLRNCTIVNNDAGSTNYCGGVYMWGNGGGVYNSIVYSNKPGNAYTINTNYNMEFSCSTDYQEDLLASRTGCITNEWPIFVNGYELGIGSPCTNKGNNNYDGISEAVDLNGNARINGENVDMGCYEYYAP